MNKLLELSEQMTAKLAEARTASDEGNADTAAALLDEYDALERQYSTRKALDAKEKARVGDQADSTPPETDAVKAFAAAARAGFRAKDLNESTDADGGYTVPQDITTEIIRFRDAKASLLGEVTRTAVSAPSGRRTYQVKADAPVFSVVAEGGKAGKVTAPTFGVVNYAIKKRRGYMPVTNELMADSDANLATTIMEWFADGARRTANTNILSILTAKTETALDGLAGIKRAVNVTLGSAYAATSKIYTNDDGLQYLDTLTDTTGRPLLSVSPTDPMQPHLAIGTRRIPLVILPNGDLATTGTKIPFIIGDLREAVWYFDRQLFTVKPYETGVIGDFNALENDMTLFVGAERSDVVQRDADAWVNGYIDTAADTSAEG